MSSTTREMTKAEVLSLLQPHTVKIYNLGDKPFEIKKVKARDLLSVERLDLFAKLYYIGNKDCNPNKALTVYSKHILAFNPDVKEPGRDDKAGIRDFVTAFDGLITDFKDNEFDETKSIIPVDKNGIILDGAHRIATLAFYDKDVTIARFDDVEAKCKFDYNYFFNRGLSKPTIEEIVLEMCNWKPDLRIACLWPKLSESEKNKAEHNIRDSFQIAYETSFRTNLKALSKIIYSTYHQQPWVGTPENGYSGSRDKAMHCMGSSGKIRFIVFDGNGKDVTEFKEKLRNIFGMDKHSIHITDNAEETRDVITRVLCNYKEMKSSILNKTLDFVEDQYNITRKIRIPLFKTWVYRLIHMPKE